MSEVKWYRKRIFSRIILILIGVIVGLLVVEGGLRLFEAVTGNLNRDLEGRGQLLEDDKLGLRVAANAPGHDANGFRNTEIPEDIDIVCIGDSQTWGNNAAVQHAWPQTLERLSGTTVYNMGMGGYNPPEYWYLVDEAANMSPDVIVIGIYMGNDITGAFYTVYQSNRLPSFRDPDAPAEYYEINIQSRIDELEENQATYKSWIHNNLLYSWAMNLRNYSAAVRQFTDGLRNILSPTYNQEKIWAQENPEEGSYYETDKVKTILTTARRLQMLETELPQNKEGLRITLDILSSIKDKTDQTDTNLLILLIPTEETVYSEAVEELQGSLSTTYERLVQQEYFVKSEIISLCKDKKMEYIDALPYLREGITKKEQLYPESSDGHPLALGYYYIASAAWEKLDSLDWLD
ncbi:MAG: hypothetical protein JW712_07715 [Dehalococcoidales bacterium]|nr:hypothetical protein [Dehalococcoidales bacterium]